MSEAKDEIELTEEQVLVVPDNFDTLEDFSDFEFKAVSLDEFYELAKKKEDYYGYYLKPGKYPKKAKLAKKRYGYAYPKYPHYGYYYYGYPYYAYPYYGYYGKKKKLSEDIFDILPLAEDYKSFMKKCMNEKKDIEEVTERMKACAAEYRKTEKEEEEKEPELAEYKCPACDKVFKTLEEAKAHWKEKHEKKYGEYSKAKKLAKELFSSKELRASFRKAMALSEEEEEEEEEWEEEEEEEELGKAKCPACGKEFDTFKQFKEHWKEKHEGKYGSYGKVKKLAKELITNKELRETFRKVLELQEEGASVQGQGQEKKEEKKEAKEATPKGTEPTVQEIEELVAKAAKEGKTRELATLFAKLITEG